MGKDLQKQELYEGVKTLYERQIEGDESHLHLTQHKLFTLFSIAFQYLLYQSTKSPGAYLIRIEDSHLAEKLARKSKDPSTRKFLQSLLLPRRLKYGRSTFYLDFFNLGTWGITSDIPPQQRKVALVIKNTSGKVMNQFFDESEEEDPNAEALKNLPEDYYYSTLQEAFPKSLLISIEDGYQGVNPVEFPFIKKEKEKTVSGVTINDNLDWDKFED